MPVEDYQELQNERMMVHLMATLESGHSIGHYGRLTFAMIARYFMDEEELCSFLRKDPECDDEEARGLIAQINARDYNPPKRERILDWMRRQDFPVCPDTSDPGQCNVYRNLEFPKEVYERINQFHQHSN